MALPRLHLDCTLTLLRCPHELRGDLSPPWRFSPCSGELLVRGRGRGGVRVRVMRVGVRVSLRISLGLA